MPNGIGMKHHGQAESRLKTVKATERGLSRWIGGVADDSGTRTQHAITSPPTTRRDAAGREKMARRSGDQLEAARDTRRPTRTHVHGKDGVAGRVVGVEQKRRLAQAVSGFQAGRAEDREWWGRWNRCTGA